MKKTALSLLCLLLFSLVLNGCKQSPFLSPTPTASATATITPSPSPTPPPTPTPTPLPAVRAARADQYLLNGDYLAALNEFQAAALNATDNETQIHAQTGLAAAYRLTGNCPQAEQTLQTLLTAFPSHPQTANAWYLLAECQRARSDSLAAAQSYANYIAMRPGVLDDFMHTQSGDTLLEAGEWNGALAAYQAALRAGANPDSLAFKIGEVYTAQGDFNSAVRVYMSLYESTNNDYTKAEADLRAGQTYLRLNLPEQAYARFNDAVFNYPRSYASYLSLIALLDAGQPVSDYQRGLVDYYAGQYALSAEAFLRYLAAEPDHDGSTHHYLALALLENGQAEAAVEAWQALIRDHPDDPFWAQAWDEIAWVQAEKLGNLLAGAQTLLTFVSDNKQAEQAPAYLFSAARMQERANALPKAAQTWERILDEYPTAPEGYRALFLAGITRYRMGDYAAALTTFQRTRTLAVEPEDAAMAGLWIGKTHQALGNQAEAESAWRMAAATDPTGYYSERAAQLLRGEAPLTPPQFYDLAYSLERERPAAESWLRSTFNLPDETQLNGLGALGSDRRWQRGQAFWELGLYPEANSEFEALRLAVQSDAADSYRLLNALLEHGMYRSAILTSRQILDLANLSDAQTLNAPRYFNLVRFGVYYPELVLPAAQQYAFNPMLLLSVIRQESFFQSFARSSAGARGPMQIMPATGAEIATFLGWPQGYTAEDLYRPVINIPFGASYLDRQQRSFDGNLYATLAAYNGGPGNAAAWLSEAPNDPDLFLEIIRYSETRSYLTRVAENFFIYSTLYQRSP